MEKTILIVSNVTNELLVFRRKLIECLIKINIRSKYLLVIQAELMTFVI